MVGSLVSSRYCENTAEGQHRSFCCVLCCASWGSFGPRTCLNSQGGTQLRVSVPRPEGIRQSGGPNTGNIQYRRLYPIITLSHGLCKIMSWALQMWWLHWAMTVPHSAGRACRPPAGQRCTLSSVVPVRNAPPELSCHAPVIVVPARLYQPSAMGTGTYAFSAITRSTSTNHTENSCNQIDEGKGNNP